MKKSVNKRQVRYRLEIGVIFFYPVIQVHSILENRRKRYFGCYQIGKKIYIIFIKVEH